jgi:hypothetical protein
VTPRKANGEPTPTAFSNTEARWCVSFAGRSQLSHYAAEINSYEQGNPLIIPRTIALPIRIPQTGLPDLFKRGRYQLDMVNKRLIRLLPLAFADGIEKVLLGYLKSSAG